MRGDEGDEVRMHEQAGLVFVPAPCPDCGAVNEAEAARMCKPRSDQAGEYDCAGEFNADGVSVQVTPESLAEMNRWIDDQVAMMEAERAPRSST